MANKIINEGEVLRLFTKHTANQITEYKTWKKNSPFLYDMILRYDFLSDGLSVRH
jgi:hypothetical protein